MAHCSSCNGLITKHDVVCYCCGEKLSKLDRPAVAMPAKSSSAWGNLALFASLGLPAYSLFSDHKLPLSISLGVSGVFLLVNLAGLLRKQLSKAPASTKKQTAIPACFRSHSLNAPGRRAAF
jgi:hypothetical protein